jgi:hypothetical protein
MGSREQDGKYYLSQLRSGFRISLQEELKVSILMEGGTLAMSLGATFYPSIGESKDLNSPILSLEPLLSSGLLLPLQSCLMGEDGVFSALLTMPCPIPHMCLFLPCTYASNPCIIRRKTASIHFTSPTENSLECMQCFSKVSYTYFNVHFLTRHLLVLTPSKSAASLLKHACCMVEKHKTMNLT